MYFSQKRQVHCFLCRISTHNYVYLITLLILQEEHNQLCRHLSVEFLVCSIHFVHFIHSYMNPLLPMTISYHLFRLLIGSSGSFLTPIPVSDWSIFCCGNSIIHQKRTKSDKKRKCYESACFTMNFPHWSTDPWFNMLENLEIRRNYRRCKVAFMALRSALLCLRGNRRIQKEKIVTVGDIDSVHD